LILDRGRNVQKVPGFFEGEVSVQDAGAQLAPGALACGSGMRVLDTCAAPGGKTGHLLEYTPGIGELVANDLATARLKRVAENLDRLGLRATLTAFDARTLRGLGGSDFDRVLVDAPCSGTGVIRRHPDIKLLRRPTDLAAMVAVQNEILEAAFSRLRAGGRLLYVTCSVVQQENEGVVRGFLARHRNARPGGFEHSMLLPPDAIRFESAFQLLPGSRSDTDGFYYACIEKTTTRI
jgi:16S rRNA (cytosine967-C5)-methyltransferase